MALCEAVLLKYCVSLIQSLSDIRTRVKAAQPQVADGSLHNIHPGDYVLIKKPQDISVNLTKSAHTGFHSVTKRLAGAALTTRLRSLSLRSCFDRTNEIHEYTHTPEKTHT